MSASDSSTSDSSTSHLAPLATLPEVAGHSVGEIVNVKGVPWVLTAAPRANVFRGLTGRSADNYVGAIRVAGSSDLGSFAGPAKVGEVTWRRLANGQTSVRLRIPRAAISGARLTTLYVRIEDDESGRIEGALHQDTGSGRETVATKVYAWTAAIAGTLTTKADQGFTARVFKDSDYSICFDVDVPRHEWKPADKGMLAGTGIRIGNPNAEGRRTIAAVGARGIAGDPLGAADAFWRPALNQKRDWRVEAIEQGEPVVVKLELATTSSPPVYNSKEPLRIDDTVTATITYTPLAGGSGIYVGKFLIITEPNSTARALKDLFPNGEVTHLTIRLKAADDAAKWEQLLMLPVEKIDDFTDTLVIGTKTKLGSDKEGPLATNNVVYAQVNFVVRDAWRREPESDLTAITIRESSLGDRCQIGDITSDGMSLYVLDHNTFGVAAFTNGKEDPLKSLDAATVKCAFAGTDPKAVGLATDGTYLYVLSATRLVAFTPNGAVVRTQGTYEGSSALTYDGSHLLVGGIRHRGGQVLPRVRTYTTDLDQIHGLPLHLGRPLERVNENENDSRTRHLKVGALAFGDGVVYVGDTGRDASGNADEDTGRVRAFLEDGTRDETKEPPASVTVPNMKGMTVHNGRLYVAVGQAALAYVIPRDRYVFLEGYQSTTLDQEGLRKAAAARTIAVDELPAPGTAGRQVWVKRDYVVDPGCVSVQPAAFTDTALDGLGYGARGWWRRGERGHAIGSILGAFDDLVLLSNSLVAIRTGSIAGISKLHVGAAEYSLTLATGKRNVKLTGAADEPAVDVYEIGGGGLPSTGAWLGVWIEGAASARYPATVKIEQGEYLDTGSAWSPAGFEAPPGDTEHDFRVRIQETVPGAAQAKEVEFVRQAGSGAGTARYVKSDPFDNILSLTFDGSPNENRYLVRIPSDRAVGGGIPARIKVGDWTYALTAHAAEDGVAVFRTPAVDSSVRINAVNAANLRRGIDVQYADGTWANGVGKRQVVRTLDRPALQWAANGVPEVTQLPRAPFPGQRVRLLVADHLPGSGILQAELAAGDHFVGYESARIGSLTEAPDNGIDDIAILGSYLQHPDDLFHNRAIVARTSHSNKVPQAVWINGRKYSVSPVGGLHSRFWKINGTDGSTFVAGRTYRVQLQWADGTKVYTDKQIGPDDYTRDGQLQWMLTPGLRCVHDRPIGAAIGDSDDRGLQITDTSAMTRSPFEAFSPSFDLDLVAAGALSSQLELEIVEESRSVITIGFDEHYTLKYREGAMATVAAIKQAAAYTSGAVEGKGVVVAATPIHRGTDKLGELRLYLARNASDKLGCLLDYAPLRSDREGLTVTAKLTLSYQPFLAGPASAHGAGP